MIALPPVSLPLLASLIVVAAAGASVIVRDGRAVAVGVLAALLVSPFVMSPVPGGLQLAARAVAALMAAYVLWVVMKGGTVRSEGSAIGPVAEIAIAAGAYAIGWWIQPVNPLAAPQAEQAAGFTLVALAILPLAGSNPLRAGVGVLLAILGASMVMDAWLGQMPPLGQLALTALLLAIPAAMSVLVDADDPAAGPVPAIESVRPDRLVPAPRVNPFGGGELEPIAAEPYPTFSASEPRVLATEAAAIDVDVAEAAAADAEVAGRDVAAAEADEPVANVTGPRPSVRFLGRNAPLRHPSDASQARGPSVRRLPGFGRHSDPGRDLPAPEDVRPAENRPGDGESGADARKSGGAKDAAAEQSIRNSRSARDPRSKRPSR